MLRFDRIESESFSELDPYILQTNIFCEYYATTTRTRKLPEARWHDGTVRNIQG